jgi:hypothetical protein
LNGKRAKSFWHFQNIVVYGFSAFLVDFGVFSQF